MKTDKLTYLIEGPVKGCFVDLIEGSDVQHTCNPRIAQAFVSRQEAETEAKILGRSYTVITFSEAIAHQNSETANV